MSTRSRRPGEQVGGKAAGPRLGVAPAGLDLRLSVHVTEPVHLDERLELTGVGGVGEEVLEVVLDSSWSAFTVGSRVAAE